MGFGMNIGRLVCLSSALFALSCAESGGTVSVDAEYNLTCPDDSNVGCNPPALDTCLNVSEDGFFAPGWRSIVGSDGDTACTGDFLAVACEPVTRPDGGTFIALEAFVGDEFALALDAIVRDGAVEGTCHVTITEDGADYGGRVTGVCGSGPPSPPSQPCQLTIVSMEGGVVELDLECESILSDTSGLGFDVGAVGGGPTRIKFDNCTDF